MQKYFAGELRPDQLESWKAEDGIFYLVTEVDVLMEEKDNDIQLLGDSLNGLNEEIAAMKTTIEKYKAGLMEKETYCVGCSLPTDLAVKIGEINILACLIARKALKEPEKHVYSTVMETFMIYEKGEKV